MGNIAKSLAAYAQPLLDETDGSVKEMNKALSLAQLCWNLAVLPEKESEKALGEMQAILEMPDNEFEGFQNSVVLPMIRRHQAMFPGLHPPRSYAGSSGLPSQSRTATQEEARRFPGIGRNAPCPCNSGKKYKRCCGR